MEGKVLVFISSITAIMSFPLGISCLFTKLKIKNEKYKGNRKIISAWDIMWIVGILCGVVFSVMAFGMAFHKINYPVCIIFVLTGWLGNFLMYGWLNMIICYDNETFTYGVLPFQKKHYTFKDITGKREDGTHISLLMGDKQIAFDEMMMDCYEFMKIAEATYKEQNGKPIPIVKIVPAWDIYRGNVVNPEGHIIGGLLVPICVLIFALYALYDAHDFVKEQETYIHDTTIHSYEIKDHHLIMSDSENEYIIFRYQEYGEATEQLIHSIEKNTKLHLNTIASEKEKNIITQYEICAAKSETGNLYFSLDTYNANQKKYGYSFLPYLIVLFIFPTLFFISSVIVGRNPKKYSKRVQKFFFRDGYLRY